MNTDGIRKDITSKLDGSTGVSDMGFTVHQHKKAISRRKRYWLATSGGRFL